MPATLWCQLISLIFIDNGSYWFSVESFCYGSFLKTVNDLNLFYNFTVL